MKQICTEFIFEWETVVSNLFNAAEWLIFAVKALYRSLDKKGDFFMSVKVENWRYWRTHIFSLPNFSQTGRKKSTHTYIAYHKWDTFLKVYRSDINWRRNLTQFKLHKNANSLMADFKSDCYVSESDVHLKKLVEI